MNPDIKVTFETQPTGTEGDNLVKTKLATGEMADVFAYNSGSLFQAINPDQNLVPLTDEAWAADLSEEFKTVVSTGQGPVRCSERHHPGRWRPLQQEGLLRTRAAGAHHLGGVQGQQRQDQGRRQGRPDPADLR